MLGARLWTGGAFGTGLHAIKHARGVPEYPLTLAQPRGRRLPAHLQTRVQELLGRRTVIPDGDRRHGSVSRDIVRQIQRSGERYEYVVRVLILRYDLFHTARGPVAAAPLQNLLERGVGADLGGEFTDLSIVELRSVRDRYSHVSDPLARAPNGSRLSCGRLARRRTCR